MSRSAARPAARRPRGTTAAGLVVVVVAAIAGILVQQSASAPAPSVRDVPRGDRGGTPVLADRAVSGDHGALPDGVTVFDDAYAGVAKLDPDLLRALREAARDAAEDGVVLYVNSGWRSREYQERLRREAVAEHGSEAEAARWVATADTSPHVSGDAVDVGPSDAVAWLAEHGAEYGLCQIYRNEPWHYELRPESAGRRCPRMYPDPTHDPRMRR